MPLFERTHSPRPQSPRGLPARQERAYRALTAAFAALALFAGGSGCATPPTASKVISDANAGAEPMKIKSSRGELSPERSRAIVERVKALGPDADMLMRHLVVEEAVADSPLTIENRTTLLQDGPATYKAMFEAIEAAKDHVFVEMYIVEDDEIGQKFAELWLKKQKAGVPVSLLYDSVGSVSTPKEYFQRLKDGGVTVAEFNPVNPLKASKGWELNDRDHRKLVVVDGLVGFVGGINISGVYSGGSSTLRKKSKDGADAKAERPWRDTQVMVEGPVVVELEKSFLQSWAKAAVNEQPPTKQLKIVPKAMGREAVRVLAGWSDEKDTVNPIYATFVSAITQSQKSVHLTMAYFVPDPETMKALTEAARRGVDVQIIVPSFSDFWAVFHAGRSKYEELLEAGVKIHERKDRLLHSKTAVVDGVWSTVGSANLDWRSFIHNNELNLVILGQGFGDQMEAAFRDDVSKSVEITKASWSNRPIKNRVLEASARVWQYWL